MKKPPMRILWLSGVACNGNTHSFLNYPFMEQFLKDFTFISHPIIDSEYTLEEVVQQTIPCDILLVEGAINAHFTRADVPITQIILNYAPIVQKIVTVGTCATFGGMFHQSYAEPTTGLHFDQKMPTDTFAAFKAKTLSISGCPIHPEVLVNTLYSIKNRMPMTLDHYLRPKAYFAYTVHNGCVRNEYFEYKIDNHQFGNLEGCMFYEHGCQAPFTHGSCNKILWNEVNSKTRAGQPCMGCTEPTFPKTNLYATKKNMGIPQHLPLGVAKRTYLTLAGVSKAFTIDRLEKGLFDD